MRNRCRRRAADAIAQFAKRTNGEIVSVWLRVMGAHMMEAGKKNSISYTYNITLGFYESLFHGTGMYFGQFNVKYHYACGYQLL